MVLDEPTNDLDVETLEVLEEYLLNYPGTILLVSHDRALINNVVTTTLVFEGSGIVKEYVGGYDDWQCQRRVETKSAKASKGTPAVKTTRPKTRFGFRQKKELEELPHTVEALETEQKELYKAMADPELYKNEKSGIVSTTERLEELKKLLAESYARWEELEDLKNEPGS